MFSSLKIVELASVLAGPAVGTFFAELGAKVIKIENKKTGGDVTRTWRVPGEKSQQSAYYSAVNWGKQTLFIDLYDESQLQQVKQLISQADLVIANYKPGDAFKLGMSYDQLQALNPHLIYLSLSGFDRQPDRVAYDVVLQAETGFMYMNGLPDSGPIKMPVALIDLLAAHQLKEAALIALLKRERGQGGSYVECSLEKAALASLANQATNWLMNHHDPQPIGSLHPNIAPYGEIFTTADQSLFVLAVGSDSQFKQLWKILFDADCPEEFDSNPKRLTQRTVLAKKLQSKFQTLPFANIKLALESGKIPFGKIKAVSEVLDGEVAKSMLLSEQVNDQQTLRLSSIAFNRFW